MGTALLTYWVGRRYGTRFFQGRVGRMILQPGQMVRLGALYAEARRQGDLLQPLPSRLSRRGAGLRGDERDDACPRTALPIALASRAVVRADRVPGRHGRPQLGADPRAVESSGRWLGIAAAILFAIIAWWWWKTRGEEEVVEELIEEDKD